MGIDRERRIVERLFTFYLMDYYAADHEQYI